MDKKTNHHKSTRENNYNNTEQTKVLGSAAAAGDRVKRDEWSEGAVSSLLEAYERKWVLRNRAKLKGQDWEDVARHVSSRGGSVSSSVVKSPKTQTQCKNKIESMKKRYRSESAIDASSSTWPLYSRLHLLLRGSAAPMTVKAVPVTLPLPPQNSHGQSNGVDVVAKQEEEAINKNTLSDHASDKNINTNNDNNSSTEDNAAQAIAASESSTSTPAVLYSEKSPGKTATPPRGNNNNNNNNNRIREKKKLRRSSSSSSGVVAESVRWLAEAVVKSERVRAELTREIEKIRAEAEARRSEMELRRTEIIANTQLEIARIFAGISTTNNNTNANATTGNKAVDSSLRIGRN